jgi:hypothetical protein
MNGQNKMFQKLGRASASLGIAAAVIAVVILLNVVVTALCTGRLWFSDITSEGMYTLTEPAEKLLISSLDSVNANRAEDDPVQVDIIFCTDPDVLISSDVTRYIYYTALSMEKAYPESINVSTVNVWENPSAVDDYRTDSYSSIYQSHIIISSGTEFRIYAPAAFYIWDYTGYYGEQVFLQGILTVTQAESPICCLTWNHGEPFAPGADGAIDTEYTLFLDVLENSGYEVRLLNLETEEIPEDCRLIVTMDPQTDFKSSFNNASGVSEIDKLDAYLSADNAYMVFADADTPKLSTLEEYLEVWGIVFSKYNGTADDGSSLNGRLQIVDPDNKINAAGTLFSSVYEAEGVGGAMTREMREEGGSPKVVFGNAASISYAPTYQPTYVLADEDAGTGAFTYGYYYGNGSSREMYDVFRSDATAYAYGKVNGAAIVDGAGNPVIADTMAPYRLMTITRESRIVGEGNGMISNINNATYVCAVASVDFVSNAVLSTNSYGNTDALLSTLRQIGLDIQPVGIKVKLMAEIEVGADYHNASAAQVTTVWMMVIPALVLTGIGTVVLVKRKYRT